MIVHTEVLLNTNTCFFYKRKTMHNHFVQLTSLADTTVQGTAIRKEAQHDRMLVYELSRLHSSKSLPMVVSLVSRQRIFRMCLLCDASKEEFLRLYLVEIYRPEFSRACFRLRRMFSRCIHTDSLKSEVVEHLFEH